MNYQSRCWHFQCNFCTAQVLLVLCHRHIFDCCKEASFFQVTFSSRVRQIPYLEINILTWFKRRSCNCLGIAHIGIQLFCKHILHIFKTKCEKQNDVVDYCIIPFALSNTMHLPICIIVSFFILISIYCQLNVCKSATLDNTVS